MGGKRANQTAMSLMVSALASYHGGCEFGPRLGQLLCRLPNSGGPLGKVLYSGDPDVIALPSIIRRILAGSMPRCSNKFPVCYSANWGSPVAASLHVKIHLCRECGKHSRQYPLPPSSQYFYQAT